MNVKKLFVVLPICLILSACTNPYLSEEEPRPSVSLDFSYTNGTYQKPNYDINTSVEVSDEEYDLSDPAPGSGYIRSELTHEWIPGVAKDLRPLAVMVPNNLNSLPHYTLSKAGVLYECNVEYEITRFMALYDDWTGLERIGNIRSARDYFVYWALEYDPIFVHIGNIWYADQILANPAVNNINGAVKDSYFYRVSEPSRDYDQSAYINGYSIKKAAKDLGYSTEHTTYYQPGHFSFASKGRPTTLTDVVGNKSAVYVSLAEAYPIDQPYFIYNESDGLYYRYEYGMAHMDGTTNTQLTFSNIIVQNTYREYRPDGSYLIYRCHDTTKDGYFITRGRAVHVNWKKEGPYGITKYYDDNGDEIILNQGKTMICIVEDGDFVQIE